MNKCVQRQILCDSLQGSIRPWDVKRNPKALTALRYYVQRKTVKRLCAMGQSQGGGYLERRRHTRKYIMLSVTKFVLSDLQIHLNFL